MRLDSRSLFPSGMERYLEYYGWHFSKKMEEWASSRMYKEDKSHINPYTKEEVENLLKTNNVLIPVDYDTVYVANMGKADFLGSSIKDDAHLALFIKDMCEDPDSYEGMPFTRFYADCIGAGVPIHWEDML